MASASHIDTRGVSFPRLMSLADAFEQLAASAISESFTVPSAEALGLRQTTPNLMTPSLGVKRSGFRFRQHYRFLRHPVARQVTATARTP